MGGEDGREGPKVARGLQVTEVVIGRRDGTAREEPGPRGVAEDAALLFGEVAEKSSHPRISLPLMIYKYILFSVECGDAQVCLFHWRQAASIWGLIYCTNA